MQSFFTQRPSKQKKTKLQRTQELQEFIPLLDELNIKNQELTATINGSLSHSHYLKSLIVSTVVRELDFIVNKYNASSDDNLHSSVFEFAKSICKLLEPYVTRYKIILNASRSPNKDMVRSAVNYGSKVASAFIGVIESGGSLIAGAISTVTLAPVINEKVSQITGLSDMRADSFRILEDLLMKANQILTNMNTSEEISNLSADESLMINGCLLLTNSEQAATDDLRLYVIPEYNQQETTEITIEEEKSSLQLHKC